ncbi:hypothetical protein HC028_16035 [Planosporangium flavigriseum]|uniref:permease-like cell division protein FtsX n=1 Tax=Planosporangium flavigriseum TaxID=373681 RepID=UPI00143B6982|nr:permease-like cell division protein FtsX [Planosporangium flavigriseum]NJC66001.1 hypothetical protein [Planosporangium flavigriseum]
MRRSLPVAALALTLSLVGCSKTTSHESDKRSAGSNLSVFLTSDVTNEERSTVEQKLRALPSIQNLSLETKEQAYARFKELFKDAPDLVAQIASGRLGDRDRAPAHDAIRRLCRRF